MIIAISCDPNLKTFFLGLNGKNCCLILSNLKNFQLTTKFFKKSNNKHVQYIKNWENYRLGIFSFHLCIIIIKIIIIRVLYWILLPTKDSFEPSINEFKYKKKMLLNQINFIVCTMCASLWKVNYKMFWSAMLYGSQYEKRQKFLTQYTDPSVTRDRIRLFFTSGGGKEIIIIIRIK